MKAIYVQKCSKCPFVLKNDGGGHCSAFTTCEKFHIMLHDWDGPEKFDIHSGIHPDCKLPNVSLNQLNKKE